MTFESACLEQEAVDQEVGARVPPAAGARLEKGGTALVVANVSVQSGDELSEHRGLLNVEVSHQAGLRTDQILPLSTVDEGEVEKFGVL